MSARREPSEPPVIPGFRPGRLLGMGGFADVFLYTQEMPRRQVAVKVLLASSLSDQVRERFRAEADLMATLSHHPSIVTVFQADVAPDGRPYLVMEYCSRPGLGRRYRSERMSVPEVLRIGVRLASAVETAHRAGILHRDIKPANVLVTDFGWPALTDFGIAATTGWSTGTAIGMSIPWSPPELLAERPTGDVRSDVYSLAATVYSLLAGRSPFEIPDGPNTAADLIARIERAPLPSTGRPDVPDSLHAALARAMDRLPTRRFHSALAFARALQAVEANLSLPLTPLDLPDDADPPLPGGEIGTWPGSADDDPADSGQATRLRPVVSVAPDGPPVPPPDPSSSRPIAVAPALVPSFADGVPQSWLAPQAPDQPAEPAAPRRWLRVVGAATGVVVVAAVATGAVLAFQRDTRVADEPSPTAPTAAVVRAVPAPTQVQGTLTSDGVVFTWTNPEPKDGDGYLWAPVEMGGERQRERIEVPSVTVPVTGERVCVNVYVVRSDGRASAPAEGCVTT